MGAKSPALAPANEDVTAPLHVGQQEDQTGLNRRPVHGSECCPTAEEVITSARTCHKTKH